MSQKYNKKDGYGTKTKYVDFTQSFHPFHKHVSTFFTDETDCCNCTITGNITFDFEAFVATPLLNLSYRHCELSDLK
jgi:hypothetical protein